MVKNDFVKNVKYDIFKDIEGILSDKDQALHRLKEVLGDRRFLSFKAELRRQVDDIPFPDMMTHQSTIGMMISIAKNYLFDLRRDLDAGTASNEDGKRMDKCLDLINNILLDEQKSQYEEVDEGKEVVEKDDYE